MPGSDRLLELLALWEEQRAAGEPVTAEELCPDDPVLQQALRQRIQRREHLHTFWDPGTRPVAEATSELEESPELPGYLILGELGRGGMGVVYKAWQIALGRPVALKVILSGAHASAEERVRFLSEGEAVAQLHHPNVVQVFEVGRHGNIPYLVLELVEGGSLAQRLAGTPLSARQAAELALQLARAVQHAHEHGVLHRDLKPANVLLDPDGTPKITDFGLARRLEAGPNLTRTGDILGTPSYMAPEQAEGRSHGQGPAVDIWALGAILYELLTGRPPFKGATPLQTLEQVRTHDPVPPSALQPGLPRDLEIICLKCLEKEPGHRYLSAAALTHDLASFLQGEPISARPLTVLERLTRTLGYSGPSPQGLNLWSTSLLLAAPIPAAVQLTLWWLFSHWPAYPLICVFTGVLAAAVLAVLLLRPFREPLRRLSRTYRRHAASLLLMRCAGWLLVPVLVALLRPGHDLAEFYLVFPLWIFLDGNLYLMMGSQAGLGYPVALLHYTAAVLVALTPGWGPVLAGVLLSGTMVLDGLYLRRLGK